MPHEDAAQARKISNLIDDGLRRDFEALKRKQARRPAIKVMLLGQAESGKSTLRKQFQLYYSSKSLEQERPAWRPVVHANVIVAARALTEALGPDAPDVARLAPLLALEGALAAALSGGVAHRGACVRADWQALFAWRPSSASRASDATAVDDGVAGLAARHIEAAAPALARLWASPAVWELLKAGEIVLEESASFFLDNIFRIAQADYLPTNEDILAVRLRTLGIAEHTFDISHGGTDYSWILYDVGGARGQRPSWIPFFDDATAIIFLAPVSAFDQYLEEDARVNRMDDSLQLWTLVCTNKLLRKAALVLLLNKADLLRKKLADGVRIRKFVTSYGDRANTFEEASHYFRGHFVQVQKRKDASKRPLYVQFSNMIDINDSQRIITTVNDSIIKKHLEDSGLVLA